MIVVFTYKNDNPDECAPKTESIILSGEIFNPNRDGPLTTLDYEMPEPADLGLWAWVDDGKSDPSMCLWSGRWRRLDNDELFALSLGAFSLSKGNN